MNYVAIICKLCDYGGGRTLSLVDKERGVYASFITR